MSMVLSISPHGMLIVDNGIDEGDAKTNAAIDARIKAAFRADPSAGLLHLATVELQSSLPAQLSFLREFASSYLTRFCQMPRVDRNASEPVAAPNRDELAMLALKAPPMRGREYLQASVLDVWWNALDEYVGQQLRDFAGDPGEFLKSLNPLWRHVGRVTFHLAENKRDDSHPFAFMASYTHRLSNQGQPQHLPLSRALQEYAGANNRQGLISLLSPIQQAAERVEWVKQLVESGGIYQPLAWTPKQAHALLRDVEALERAGLIVRVPDWWKRKGNARPRVQVRIGEAAKSKLGMDALLDFHVGVALGDQQLDEASLRELMSTSGNLVQFRGKWLELDREKLTAALDHWKKVERDAAGGGISFIEGMRLLAGAQLTQSDADAVPENLREWTGIKAGGWLDQTLKELRDPGPDHERMPSGFNASLRPYQISGVNWLRFMTRLGLGACLADDMGLGKTVQVLAMLLGERDRRDPIQSKAPALLVLPASLIANWQAEIERFTPTLRLFIAHPSSPLFDLKNLSAIEKAITQFDVVITTYGMIARLETLRGRQWSLLILDEAQAIKNSGSRQSRAVKEIQATSRIALTGTPIENRLSDLWSLFDFLNPGLLGNAKDFGRYVKAIQKQEPPDFSPLRMLAAPYILRRLKTDKRIIADLPDKTEVKTFCALSPQQAGMYEQSVKEMSERIATVESIQRRGIVLAYLMRLKQICNHPSHWTGDGDYSPAHSGKFERLAELCEELAERQEKVLIFTQFREIAQPLADHLRGIFGVPGLVLTGSSAVAKRRQMVNAFQREDGPPFFVLSLKAGGTGLNLTAASQVVHFDRWWNPAVENQATDRAFRIGQKRNVLVHKFICRGTVEEKIDALISDKVALSNSLLDAGGAEVSLTELSNSELIRFVSLDLNKATNE